MFVRYILALGNTMLVPRVAFANVRRAFCQISETSQPKAVSKVVADRFYGLYVRSIHFGAWKHNACAACGIC